MVDASFKPSLEDGFTHLDVELADLLGRHLASKGFGVSHPDFQWWCAAAAIASRAHAAGHVCVDLANPGMSSDLDALTPADPKWLGNLRTLVDRFLSHQPEKVAGTLNGSHAVEQEVHASGLLVRDGHRVYLRRLWSAECRVAAALAERARSVTPLSPEGLLRAHGLLQAWFDDDGGPASQDQQEACVRGAQSRLSVITGGPGTGKTYTAARLIALLQALRPAGAPCLRVALAAPTGKAAARLRQALEQAWRTLREHGLPAPFWEAAWGSMQAPRTVHALLAQWRRDRRAVPALVDPSIRDKPFEPSANTIDLLLVDEASMLDLDLLDELLKALPPTARLVLMGDPDQLASVEAGSVMADICWGLHGHQALAPLQHSRRFHGTIGRWARGLKAGEGRVLHEIERQAQGGLSRLVEKAAGPEGWEPFLHALSSWRHNLPSDPAESSLAQAEFTLRTILQQLDQFRVLAGVRQGPWGVESLNARIEAALAARGWIDGAHRWPHGRVLMVTRNDDSTGLRNGDVGVVVQTDAQGAQFAWLAGQDVRRVGVARLPPTEWAYAMTIHKSQGSEFNRVLLVLPDTDSPVLTRELLYTGLTRAREEVQWFIPAPSLLTTVAGRHTRRMSGLGRRLRDLMGTDATDPATGSSGD